MPLCQEGTKLQPDSAAPAALGLLTSHAHLLTQVLPAGQILEKLNGITADKRMADRHFRDISYVQDMAWQVLTALDQAQRTLGGSQAGGLLLHNCCGVPGSRLHPSVWCACLRQHATCQAGFCAETVRSRATGCPDE